MELEVIKELFNLAVKNPAYIIPSIIILIVFLIIVAGKYRAHIVKAVCDKIPFGIGKRLYNWYKNRIDEEDKELESDSTVLVHNVRTNETLEINPYTVETKPDLNANKSNYTETGSE